MTLTPDQLTAIDRHLRKENWLLNEALITELTDHYIDSISERMSQGITFDTAIREIHQNFGGRKGLLQMEEDYQVSQSRQLDVLIWREIRQFFEQPRLPVLISIFGLLFCLNAFSEVGEIVSSFFSTGILLMSVSVAGSILASVVLIIKHRREVSKAMLMPSPFIFFVLYAMGMCQMLAAKYVPDAMGLSLSTSLRPWGNTLIEVLVIVYFSATIIALKKFLRPSVKPA